MVRGIFARATGGRRVAIAAIAYACLLAYTSALAHRVLVAHVVCAEHGEAVHLAEAEPTVASAGSVGSTQVDTSAARISRLPTVASDEHDHCSVVLCRSVAPRATDDRASGPAPALVSREHGSATDTMRGAATYRIAPKTSPPFLA